MRPAIAKGCTPLECYRIRPKGDVNKTLERLGPVKVRYEAIFFVAVYTTGVMQFGLTFIGQKFVNPWVTIT